MQDVEQHIADVEKLIQVLDRLAALGPVGYFDPESDAALPLGECGEGLLYLPGGYPEKHLEALAGAEETRRAVRDAVVPYIAMASPLLCYGIDYGAGRILDYHFGYELLMLNGLFTFLGLYITAPRRK